jgi:D-sedoheptulose 7-phosphate isomerase
MESVMDVYIADQIKNSYKLKQEIFRDNSIRGLISKISFEAIKTLKNKGKILIAGNGGSASDAQHIAGELVSKFFIDRDALASVALTTDTSVITAIGNDYGFENIFSRQIQSIGNQGDVFIAISTSGNSENIIKALRECKEKKIITVGLSGDTGGKMKELCDYCICVPSNITPRIQECHILIGHIICAIIEKEIFGDGF